MASCPSSCRASASIDLTLRSRRVADPSVDDGTPRAVIGEVERGADLVGSSSAGGRRSGRGCRPSGPVSAHASAREATLHSGRPAPAQTSFNPRLFAGGDIAGSISGSSSSSFNPRLRAGGDTPGPKRTATLLCFNPRLRAGGDCGLVSRSMTVVWGVVSANLWRKRLNVTWPSVSQVSKSIKRRHLRRSRTSQGFHVHLGFAQGAPTAQMISGSSGSWIGLAPWCSLRPFQALPRK